MKAEDFLRALKTERDFVAKGIGFKVASARREHTNYILQLAPLAGRRSSALDESLEGSRALWGEDGEGRGEVIYVNADEGEVILRFCQGTLPEEGDRIQFFMRDFLSPVITLWENPEAQTLALRAAARRGGAADEDSGEEALPAKYSMLRQRQANALARCLDKSLVLYGPPGTGKTFTVGAMISRQLTKYKNSKVIITGPTNVAVDTALLSAAEWLERNGRKQITASMKRVGSRFDVTKYRGREELLAPGVYDAATQLAALELDEPSKRNVQAYVEWKEAVERARANLKAELTSIVSTARVIAATTASLALWYDSISAHRPWHFLVCDEASQIPLPTSLMMAALAERSVFAGDPEQLAPIVQCDDKSANHILGSTIFQSAPNAARVKLNEQSRMCVGICHAVSQTFYEGELIVSEKERNDAEWKRKRSPFFIDGREVPRLYFEPITQTAKWSAKYNGFIRFESAGVTRDVVEAFLGSYAELDHILILTPFRAQRALMRRLFNEGPLRNAKISTVHRAQGSERLIVVFDPVDAAGSFLNSPNGRRLINVAVSRAQAHVVILANESDFRNPWIKKLRSTTQGLFHRPGEYYKPFQVKRSALSRESAI